MYILHVGSHILWCVLNRMFFNYPYMYCVAHNGASQSTRETACTVRQVQLQEVGGAEGGQ